MAFLSVPICVWMIFFSTRRKDNDVEEKERLNLIFKTRHQNADGTIRIIAAKTKTNKLLVMEWDRDRNWIIERDGKKVFWFKGSKFIQKSIVSQCDSYRFVLKERSQCSLYFLLLILFTSKMYLYLTYYWCVSLLSWSIHRKKMVVFMFI